MIIIIIIIIITMARLPYRNNTCINKCAAYSVNTDVPIRRDSRKSQQTFVKIAKITAKTQQRHGIKSRAQRPLGLWALKIYQK